MARHECRLWHKGQGQPPATVCMEPHCSEVLFDVAKRNRQISCSLGHCTQAVGSGYIVMNYKFLVVHCFWCHSTLIECAGLNFF
jgi:hypothetical protein